MADDELWHVRISADEVKTLTLEQIDDLYRLDVIDADTQLWQDGMDEWLPLRVVAGLDEEEVVSVSVPPTMPPPAKAVNTMSSWPPVAASPQSFAPSSRPSAPVSRVAAAPAPPSARPAAPSVRPAAGSVRPPVPSHRPVELEPKGPTSVRPPVPSHRPVELEPKGPTSVRPPVPSHRPVELAPTGSSWPPAAGDAAQPFGLSASYAPPAGGSVRPQMISPVPYAYPKATNPMPIVLAAIVGLVITLYRNDVVRSGARTVGQEAAYLKLETALGGPGFGTPRAVEPMAKAAAALQDIAPLPAPKSTPRYEASSSDSSDSSSTPTTKAATPSRPEPKLLAPAAPQPQAASRSAATRPVADTPNPVFKQPKGAKKAKGNEFNPLNPNL